MPAWIPPSPTGRPPAPREKRTLRYPLVNDELALLWMANMGCIDMNTWYSRVDRPSTPDFVLFDLDPSPDVGFAEVVQVALLIKEVLDAPGRASPRRAAPTASTSSCRSRVATRTTRPGARRDRRRHPRPAAPRARHDGVGEGQAPRRLVDANQNGEGKTIASAYSVRPNGAPVSTLRWEEVTEASTPARSPWRSPDQRPA